MVPNNTCRDPATWAPIAVVSITISPVAELTVWFKTLRQWTAADFTCDRCGAYPPFGPASAEFTSAEWRVTNIIMPVSGKFVKTHTHDGAIGALRHCRIPLLRSCER